MWWLKEKYCRFKDMLFQERLGILVISEVKYVKWLTAKRIKHAQKMFFNYRLVCNLH